MEQSSAAMSILGDAFVVGNVSGEKGVIKSTFVLLLPFFPVKVVIDSHFHYITQIPLISVQAGRNPKWKD